MFGGRKPIKLFSHESDDGRYGERDDFMFSDDGNYLKITRITDLVPTSVSINHPSHKNKDFYYEGKMTKGNNSVALGLSPENRVIGSLPKGGVNSTSNLSSEPRIWDVFKLNAWPHFATYTYHADTGKVWNDGSGTICGHYLKVNDIIGCGLNNEKNHIFFTLNGEKLEPTFKVDPGLIWFPITGFKGDGAELELNLGKKPFAYQPTIISRGIFPPPE